MIAHARHLQDERLFECYLAEHHGEPMDLPAAEHLADCEACGARYAELATFLEALRREGEADADAVFTPERLRAQQQQIARRLEHVGRPAHVLSFPEPSTRRVATPTAPRRARRWAAAAAALLVGVALTASYELGSRSRVTHQPGPRETAAPASAAPAPARADTPVDEVFLSELELALEGPHTRALVAFDALTPYVLEVSSK